MFDWIASKFSSFKDALNNNEELIMRTGTKVLAFICIVIGLVYLVLFYFQFKNMGV